MKEDGTYAVRLLREPLAHAEPEAPQAEQGNAPPQQDKKTLDWSKTVDTRARHKIISCSEELHLICT